MTIEAAFFESKVSGAGKRYLRVNVRCGSGDNAQWVNTMVFGDDVALADRLLKGCRVYVEGSIRVDEWTGADGKHRTGLTCMAAHCRLAEIGRSKPENDRAARTSRSSRRSRAADTAAAAGTFHDDEIPF
jgi:single-stranded DNA-binding protein